MNQIVVFIRDLIFQGLEKHGLFYSQYRGFVYDNNDPNGYGRLKVSCPEVFGDNILDYWAWPDSNFSGIGYGVQCIPQVNDLIWVKFEKGNPRKPLWLYGHFGKDEKPEELRDIKNYWFKTPKGNLIELDDTNSLIRITNLKGIVLEINENGISLGTKTKSAEPAVLGNTLKSKLESLIDTLREGKINTALGPQTFMPDTLGALLELKESLDEIESEKITLD